jgi:DNA-directed RNA polymerase subunit L
MLAEISDVKDNEIELKIREEDISILYIIQHELLKEKNADFAGIIEEHPLTKDYRMTVLTRKKDDPMRLMVEASTSAQEYSKDLLNMIKSAIKK